MGLHVGSRTLVLSPSSLADYAKCGLRYWWRKVEKRTPPVGSSPAAVRGTAFHAGAEHDLRGLLATGQHHVLSDVQDAASQSFDQAAQGVSTYTDEEGQVLTFQGPPPAWALHGEEPGQTKDVVLQGLIPTWHTRIAPSVQPVSIESWAVVECADDVKVRLRFDQVPANGDLADLKHTKKSWGKLRYSTAAQAEEDAQLTAEDVGYRVLTGQPPVRLGWDTVQLDGHRVLGIAQPRVASRSEEVIARWMADVQMAARGIRAGVFPHADKNEDWWCSAKWCAYWTVCPYGGAPQAPLPV